MNWNWKPHALMIILIILCAIVQTTLTALFWRGAQPDLLLSLVVMCGLYMNPAVGSIYAFGMGYLHDLLTGGMTGIFMFDRVLIYILAYRLSHQFYAKNAGAQFALIWLLLIIDTLIVMLLSSVFGEGSVIRGAQAWHMPIRATVTAACAMPLYFIMKFIWEGVSGVKPQKGLVPVPAPRKK